jgi:hypothetical protein
MSPSVRAHRILSPLACYQEGRADDWQSKVSEEGLGEPIGCYQNPGEENDVIGIFTDGVAWSDKGHTSKVRFANIAEVTLPGGKESEGLLLRAHDGTNFHLPVRGRRGRFYDSLELLRFFDRVIGDLRREPAVRVERQ